jgi:hypothetical protein
METILKIRDLLPGTYTVNSYEPSKSSYGTTFTITATHESNAEVKFWSNGFLTDYIASRKPTKKFSFDYSNSRISIPGYSRIVNLY